MVDWNCRRRPNDEAIKRMLSAYPRPGNVPNLTVPKTNPDVWEELKQGYRVADATMQRTQGLISKSLVPALNMMNGIGTSSGK